jgi:hypothetical protein
MLAFNTLPNGIYENVVKEQKLFSLNLASATPHLVVATFHQELFF